MKKVFLFFLLIFISGITLLAQQRSLQVGFKAMGELTMYDNGFAHGAGIQLVYKSKTHFSMETGIQWQYRRALTLYVHATPPSPLDFEKAEYYTNRLQVPILVRYSSKPINITVGPVLDFEVNTTLKTNSPDPSLKTREPYGTRAGISVGVSHTFNLSGKWAFEPAVRAYYVNIDREDNGGLSIDIAFRRRIF